MNNSVKNTLLAHVELTKSSFGEVSKGRYQVVFGMLVTYVLEFKFLVVSDQGQAEYKLFKNDEIVFWIMHEQYEATACLVEYIENSERLYK